MVEAVEPFKLRIWLHTHTITTTDVSPNLGELAEIIGDVSVQTMPLRHS